MNKNKQISLILSGGGARGAFHLGILQAFDEAKIEVMAISATSIGSIVGAGYLSGNSPKKLLEIFCSNEFKKAIKFKPFKSYIFKIDKNAKVMDKIVNNYKNIEDLPKPLHVSVTNLNDGKVEYKNKGNIKDILLSASAILPVFPSVKMGENMYADGGFMDNLPFFPFENSKYPVIGVNLHPNVKTKKQGLVSNISRAIFLSWYSSVSKNIEKCDFYIAPKELSDFPILRLNRLKELFEVGLKSGRDFVEKNF